MPVLEGTDMDPTTVSDTLIIATNNGKRPLKIRYDGREYHLPPGTPTTLPYLAMVIGFGNPALRNRPGGRKNAYRQQEVERLAAYWGTGTDAWYKPIDAPTPPLTSNPFEESKVEVHEYVDTTTGPARRWKNPLLPDVTVTTYDGKRIITVIDDPEGTMSFGEDEARAANAKSEVEALRESLESTRQQQAAMIDVLRKLNPDAAEEMQKALIVPVGSSPLLPTFDGTDDAGDGDSSTDPGADMNRAPASTSIVDAAMGKVVDDAGLSDAVEADPKPTRRARKPA